MDGDNEEKTTKTCRFSGEPCTREACEQWIEIEVTKPGMVRPQVEGMCVFKAVVLVASTPKIVMAPQRMPNLGRPF